jgi:N-formylglutamate amidohydrolase
VSWRSGALPILLTASHSGESALLGVATRQCIQSSLQQQRFSLKRDLHIRELALTLAEHLEDPSVILGNLHRRFVDLNRTRAEAYCVRSLSLFYTSYHYRIRRAVRRLRARGGGLLLDLHGCRNSDFDLFLGDCYGRSLHNPTPLITLVRHFISANYSVCLNHPRFSGGYTTLRYGAACGGVDALQLEVTRDLRVDTAARTHLAAVIATALAEVAQGYSARARTCGSGDRAQACRTRGKVSWGLLPSAGEGCG